MYSIEVTPRFQRDIKRLKKKHVDLSELKTVLHYLSSGQSLPPKYKNHKLNDDNNYKNCWDCHLSGDLVLLYSIDKSTVTVYCLRLGSHDQLQINGALVTI